MMKTTKNFDKEVEQMLEQCTQFGKLEGSDTPTAIGRYITSRKAEISQEKEKIKKARIKIKKLQEYSMIANDALTLFWTRETDKRKKLFDKHNSRQGARL